MVKKKHGSNSVVKYINFHFLRKLKFSGTWHYLFIFISILCVSLAIIFLRYIVTEVLWLLHDAMYSTAERLAARTPKDGVGRFEFLEQLVKEFKATTSKDAKEQVLANLANFAYDPINYPFLRKLGVIDLFLDQLADCNAILRRFAIGGICNLALDHKNKALILRCGGVNKVAAFLDDSDEETLLSAITVLMFLISPQSKKEITKPHILNNILKHSRNENKRISNLANIFLQDYCTSEQVNKLLQLEEIQNIPMPGLS